MKDNKVKAGLIGVGLDTYWGQFEGLLPRLCGYQKEINDRMSTQKVLSNNGGKNPSISLQAILISRK